LSKNLILCLSLLSILSSCSGGGSDNVAPALVRTFDDRSGSCDYKYNEGGSAPYMLPAPNVKTSLFGKQFDASLLEAVGASSGAETVRFAQMTGVTFFKVANINLKYGCPYTQSLPTVHSIIEAEFRESEAKVQQANKDSTLEGFYLDYDMVSDALGQSNNVGPLIVVKDDSERYTIVHELMHHIYQLQNPKTGMQIQIDHSRSAREYSKAADAYNKDQSAKNFETVVSRFETRTRDFITVLINYPMEEMANETELFNLFNSGKLRYVNKNSRRDADYYIYSSAEKALERLKAVQEELSELTSIVDSSTDQDAPADVRAALKARLSAIDTKFKSTASDVRVTQSQARNRLQGSRSGSGSSSTQFGLVAAEVASTVGCNHSHGVDQQLKDIENNISKIKSKK
jgi:hypothetical protein